MTREEDKKKDGYLGYAGILLLAVHFFVVCYDPFQPPGKLGTIMDKLHNVLLNIPMFADDSSTKTLVLIITIIAAFLSTPPSRQRVGYAFPLILSLAGVFIYFSTADLLPVGSYKIVADCYLGMTLLGYLVISASIGQLISATRYVFDAKFFQPETSGFKQEEQLITTSLSLHFEARYKYNGRLRRSYVNIINPRRGVLIMGSPGSGKSWFFVEPAIEQLVQKGMALFVFDFKFPTLSAFTYNSYRRHMGQYPAGTRFYSINFSDLPHSHRCNLIDPATLEHNNDAMAISRTILLSINKTWVSRQGEFFVESPIDFLAALIWFLKVYKDGMYCTLPHVIELSKTPYEELFTLLNAEPATRGLIGPFKDAYLNKTMEMLDGQIASARIPLMRLDSPDIYYVLSGNDLSLEINDPAAPAILCLGSDSRRHEALAPVMSLYIDRLNRQINRPGRHPVAVVVDEFATVRAISLLDTIATGRSNDITPILVIQDLSQLRQRYSHDEADQILNTAGNLICGQVAGDSARWVSERFQAQSNLKTTIAVNDVNISTSKTEHMTDAITPSVLANLSSGEFAGLVADDPDKKLELKGFHASIVKHAPPPGASAPLPLVRLVDKSTIQENYKLIGQQIADLIKEDMKRILGNPELRKFVVKR